MSGYFLILIYMLAAYLIFKGVEIYQLAAMSAREDRDRTHGLWLGVVMTIIAVALAIGFIYLGHDQADALNRIMNPLNR